MKATEIESDVDRRDERSWAIVRLALGMTQMAGAVVSLVLLVETGVTAVTLATVVVTCVSTSVSVLLFGSRKPRR